jgi:hypothetical protein
MGGRCGHGIHMSIFTESTPILSLHSTMAGLAWAKIKCMCWRISLVGSVETLWACTGGHSYLKIYLPLKMRTSNARTNRDCRLTAGLSTSRWYAVLSWRLTDFTEGGQYFRSREIALQSSIRRKRAMHAGAAATWGPLNAPAL